MIVTLFYSFHMQRQISLQYLFALLEVYNHTTFTTQFTVRFQACVDSCRFTARRNSSRSPSSAHEMSSYVM
jgi:hypothetical protein